MISPKINKSFYEDYLSILEEKFRNSEMVIAFCTDNQTGDLMAVLCSAEDDENNRTVITPYATLFTSNPFDIMLPLSDTEDAIIVKQGNVIKVNSNLFPKNIKGLN
jgi:hypothetical protein